MRLGTLSGRSSVPPFYLPTSVFSRPCKAEPAASNQSSATGLDWMIRNGPGYAWPFSVGFSSHSYSHPVYCVRPSLGSSNSVEQQLAFYYKSGTSFFAYGTGDNDLQSYMNAVPVPLAANCPMLTGTAPYVNLWADGTDQSMFIWNMDTDEGYEFWEFTDTLPASIQSAFPGVTYGFRSGAYIPSVSAFNGVLPYSWGSRATSLGEIGGLITQQDIRDVFNGGTINHALAFAVPQTGGADAHVQPATRGDGTAGTNGYTCPEGTRLRLVESNHSGSHPMALAMIHAMQNYGLICQDTSGAVAFYIEDPRTLGSPYHMQGASAVDPATLDWVGRWGVPGWNTSNASVGGSASVLVNDMASLWTGSEFEVIEPVSS